MPAPGPKSEVHTARLPRPPGSSPSRAMLPHPPKWHQRFAAWLIYAAIRCLALTIRFRVDQNSRFLSELPPEKIIFVIWHNRLVLSLIIYHLYVRRRDP